MLQAKKIIISMDLNFLNHCVAYIDVRIGPIPSLTLIFLLILSVIMYWMMTGPVRYHYTIDNGINS